MGLSICELLPSSMEDDGSGPRSKMTHSRIYLCVCVCVCPLSIPPNTHTQSGHGKPIRNRTGLSQIPNRPTSVGKPDFSLIRFGMLLILPAPLGLENIKKTHRHTHKRLYQQRRKLFLFFQTCTEKKGLRFYSFRKIQLHSPTLEPLEALCFAFLLHRNPCTLFPVPFSRFLILILIANPVPVHAPFYIHSVYLSPVLPSPISPISVYIAVECCLKNACIFSIHLLSFFRFFCCSLLFLFCLFFFSVCSPCFYFH